MLNLLQKKGLIFGVANNASIALGCARMIAVSGCREMVITYLNDKALPHVQKACEELPGVKIHLVKCDLSMPGDLTALFEYIAKNLTTIDFIVHAVAFADADSLHNRVVDCKWEGFANSYYISAFSLVEICRYAKPLMPNGGSIITMSYLGAKRAISNYGMMGIVKAGLEASVRYLANELAVNNIRVYAISSGVIKTRAGAGLKGFSDLQREAIDAAPMKRAVTIDEVGNLAAFLVSDLPSGMTGQTIYVDGGEHLK